jgi:hypothetical protein
MPGVQVKHKRAQAAWRHFADNMGKDNIRRFLSTSGDKMLTLFEELKGSDASPHLVQVQRYLTSFSTEGNHHRYYQLFQGFEDALSSLIKDVKNIDAEHSRMEEMFNKSVEGRYI